ncbi:hypothetical protein B0H17DRAFT_1147097 [Mycena rosella]|uniref:Uncharacterized protein n=1 Tax=Mycena rosella TaxID=1033263 RepID=A0AAD7G3S6_MYCRO|nr:hypothetical protein B0H17DRAFT_1147097 [Mycena rosella]
MCPASSSDRKTEHSITSTRSNPFNFWNRGRLHMLSNIQVRLWENITLIGFYSSSGRFPSLVGFPESAIIRGCLRKDETCSARFPRDVYMKTEVDPADGSINGKKQEPMINCVTPDVTYCIRYNTDVTSLLSGTSIKAVVAYISDYVTKASLKIYHIFDTVKDVLKQKYSQYWGDRTREGEFTSSDYADGEFADFQVADRESDGRTISVGEDTEQDRENGDETDRVVLIKSNEGLEEKPGIDVDMPDIQIPGPVDDDWIDHDLDEAGTEEAVGDRSDAVSAHPFQPEHELFKTHCVRTGKDLKNDLDNWDESFTDYNFNEKATQLMKNFNVRYEGNDARDNFAAQDRQKRRAMPMFSRWTKEGDEDDDNTSGWDYGVVMDEVTDNHIIPGPRYLAKEESMSQAEEVMIKSGWTQRCTGSLAELPARFIPKTQVSGNQWKIRINLEKQAALAVKLKNAPAFGKQRKPPIRSNDPGNDINLLNSYYFTKYFKAKEKKA